MILSLTTRTTTTAAANAVNAANAISAVSAANANSTMRSSMMVSPIYRRTISSCLSTTCTTLSNFTITSNKNTLSTSTSSFSTKAKNNKNNKNNKQTLQSYNEEKAALKAYRKSLYDKKQERKQKLPHRRANSPKDVKRNAFHSWFDAKCKNELYWERQCKKHDKQWRVKLGLMIERLPVVTPDLEDWELEYLEMKAQLDRETSMIFPKEIVGFSDPMEEEILTREEIMAQLPEGFEPAPRITEADEKNIIQTTQRRLQDRLYLTIRPNEETGWSLPITTLNEDNNDETFVDGVKRYMKSNKMLKNISVRCLSNCPMVVDVIRYEDGSEESENGTYYGEKIFYMRVQYEEGDVKKVDNDINDWGWLERSEMVERVKAEKGEEASKFYHYML